MSNNNLKSVVCRLTPEQFAALRKRAAAAGRSLGRQLIFEALGGFHPVSKKEAA
jgi:hypothetical protein